MKLKNLAFLFAAAASSASASAAVDTMWWTVDPTQTVRRVVADAGFPTAGELHDATHVVETNRPPAAYAMSDVFLASWDRAAVFRPSARVGDAYTWTYGGMTLAWETNVWTLAGAVEGEVLAKSAASNATSVAFGTFGGVRYTMAPRYASYSIRTNTVLEAAKDYTDRQAADALAIVAGMAEAIERNAVNAATQYVKAAPIEVPAAAAAKGVTLNCAKKDVDDPTVVCGEEDNGAVEIGRNARAAVTAAALNAAPSNTVGRSVGVAIGAEADATVSDSSTKNQGIAIGWHSQAKAPNAISIGGGAQHTFEDAMSGAASYANASEAVSVGYSAKSIAPGAVQFGRGTNRTERSFQFREWQVVNGRGQIPVERLADAAEAMAGGMLSQLERLVSPGNMAVMYGGSDDQRIEPRLDGVCDVLMQPDTNGVWMSGAEAYVVPPLGSRNYDLVITNIPQAFRWETTRPYTSDWEVVSIDEGLVVTEMPSYNGSFWLASFSYNGSGAVQYQAQQSDPAATNLTFQFLPGVLNPTMFARTIVEGGRSLVPVPEDQNFLFDFSELPRGITPTLRCAASIGYVRGVSMVLTNAPLVVRMRQPATNRVVVVVKPWDEMEL